MFLNLFIQTQMAILQRQLEDHNIALIQSILDRRELERQNRYLRHDLMVSISLVPLVLISDDTLIEFNFQA